MRDRRYVVISPCRDEARFARRTLRSVTEQTVPPALWVIVDDGSTDGTPDMLSEYTARHPYIRVIRRANRGARSVGPGVIDAFYAGYETIDPKEFTYICKLDLDLDLPRTYFESLIERMEAEPRLGTCSGKAYFHELRTGRIVNEMIGDEMSVGAAKFYRTQCFEQIGGFVRQVMWDGIDCHRCRMVGWRACSWDDHRLRFLHLRPMGSSDVGLWRGRARHGAGQYFMGTSLAYMAASAAFRMTRPPLIVGGMAMLCGYVGSLLRGQPRYEDREFRQFLRAYQWRAMFSGKQRATHRAEEARRVRWEAANSAPPHMFSPG